MTRTLAPKDLGGRLDLNCARTAPELPVIPISVSTLLSQPQPLLQTSISNAHISSSNPSNAAGSGKVRTVRAGDGAPDGPDLRATDVLVGAVDEGDLLATVEARKKKHRLSKFVLLESFLTTGSIRSARVGEGIDVLGLLGGLDALQLEDAGVGVGVALATDVAHMLAPVAGSSVTRFRGVVVSAFAYLT